MKNIEIWTDGSELKPRNHPNSYSGIGAVVKYGQHTKEISVGYLNMTNNQAELLAAISALEVLKEVCNVTITTDSQYVKNSITKWVHGWKRKGWKTSDNKPVKNQEYMIRLDNLVNHHNVSWKWVKGHNGDPMNELADSLARGAAERMKASCMQGLAGNVL